MNIALIFAGGVGNRMNSKSKPKQFLELNGKPIIIHTLEKFEEHHEIDKILVVCNENWIDYLDTLLKKYQIKKVEWIIKGGNTSQHSIRNGLFKLEEVFEDVSQIVVLIHDGVRPFISEKNISENIKCVKKYGNAITAVKATETVVCVENESTIKEIYDRGNCYLARAPQSFYLGDIISAHKKLILDGDPEVVDSATLMAKYGNELHIIEGQTENIKITTPVDFYVFRAIAEAKENSQIWGL